jgi:hypothetical protein
LDWKQAKFSSHITPSALDFPHVGVQLEKNEEMEKRKKERKEKAKEKEEKRIK